MTLGQLLKQKLDQPKTPTLVDTMANMYAASATQEPELPPNRSYDVTLFRLKYYDLKTYKEETVLFCSMEKMVDWMRENMVFQTIDRGGITCARYENVKVAEHTMNVFGDDPGYCPPEYIGCFYMVRCNRGDGHCDDTCFKFCNSKQALVAFLTECSDAHPEIHDVYAIGEWKNEGDINVNYWS
jgi:hypothetical protein